jgi:putative flippase GtrA
VSFPVAVMATWLLNRSFTFRRHADRHPPLRQALIYVGVQLFGGAANFAVYSLTLKLAPALDHLLVVPLAFGAAAGLFLNFLGSKHFAFKALGDGGGEAILADLMPHEPPELTAQRAD